MRWALALSASVFGSLACSGDGPYSPDDPATFSSRMFAAGELERYSPDDRAYVMGHAIGVYLYGKTLPGEVSATGFPYRPGVSAPAARVEYDWDEVMIATSGGTDGYGTMYDDVEPPPPGTPPGDPTEPGPCEDNDDASEDGCDPEDPGDPDGDGDDGDDPWLDPDCETFLDPAAWLARERAELVVPGKVLGSSFGRDVAAYEDRFWQGMRDALHLEDLDEDVRFSEIEHLKDHVQEYGMCDHSPLVLDLAGDGVAASDPREGVRFDLFGTGKTVQTAWPSGDDALLALDRNGDGKIGSGRELFGARRGARGARNGFDALAELDQNHDGVVDARDPAFAALRLWTDANRDGVSQAAELATLASARVLSLPTAYRESRERDAAGNALRQ